MEYLDFSVRNIKVIDSLDNYKHSLMNNPEIQILSILLHWSVSSFAYCNPIGSFIMRWNKTKSLSLHLFQIPFVFFSAKPLSCGLHLHIATWLALSSCDEIKNQ